MSFPVNDFVCGDCKRGQSNPTADCANGLFHKHYLLPPVVKRIVPSEGAVGTTVEISGEHFSANTEVVFAQAEPLRISPNSAMQFKVTVPADAKTGAIEVRTSRGRDNKQAFTVTEAKR